MQRTTLNLVIDLLAAALSLGLIATGYILFFPLPPGTNRMLTLWGLSRHQWGEVHFWIALGMSTILIVHLGLHWQWLVSVVRKKLGRAQHGSLLSSGLLTILLLCSGALVFAWIAHRSVREADTPAPGCEEVLSVPPKSDQSGRSKEFAQRVTWEQVSAILERSCVSCHGPARQRAGIRLDRLEDLLGGQNALVRPRDSVNSPLIAIVTGRQAIRLPERHRLSATDVDLLKSWIDAGAGP